MNGMKTTFLMTMMMVLFIVVGSLIGGQSGMAIAFIISLALNFGSYWFSDKIVLKMYKARQVTQQQSPEQDLDLFLDFHLLYCGLHEQVHDRKSSPLV